jgi:hypothetical protein
MNLLPVTVVRAVTMIGLSPPSHDIDLQQRNQQRQTPKLTTDVVESSSLQMLTA